MAIYLRFVKIFSYQLTRRQSRHIQEFERTFCVMQFILRISEVENLLKIDEKFVALFYLYVIFGHRIKIMHAKCIQ